MSDAIAPQVTYGLPRTLETLTAGLVDYAGMFPPAGLDLPGSVDEFVRAAAGPEARMLRSIVLARTQLEALTNELRSREPSREGTATDPVPVNVISRGVDGLTDVLDATADDRWHVSGIEVTPLPGDVLSPLTEMSVDAPIYVEVPPTDDAPRFLDEVASLGLRAKVRCGGVTPDRIPSADALADFFTSCTERGLPFKATAGLHHPVRGVFPLCYDDDAPTAVLHGYLNLLVAVTAVRSGAPREAAVEILSTGSHSDFSFSDDEVQWRSSSFSADALADTRRTGLQSIGSCSISEPYLELGQLYGENG